MVSISLDTLVSGAYSNTSSSEVAEIMLRIREQRAAANAQASAAPCVAGDGVELGQAGGVDHNTA